MVPLMSLVLPIVLSAVFVFIVSAIVHMVLPIHRNDYRKLPNEDAVLEALRAARVAKGDYMFPNAASMKDCSSPEMKAKFERGPVGVMSVFPTGTPQMGKGLVMWFIYCLVISLFAGYLAGRTLMPGSDYLAVFRVVGASSFLAYGIGQLPDSIWRGQSWATTWKHVADGLVYALVTAGTFGWLWPA
ncbi:MAG TPA: hypothetical protein PLS95_02975 [Thermoanaerobaculales bacterium]|nr:hypothetical protein [Thermoanaerobaculales bacterium]HQN96067.1 hypothetical protein [Thermoanaerobaculales bacterium]HQP42687.1 hypothetical protein [Thermoanaerobaculales bacterium]